MCLKQNCLDLIDVSAFFALPRRTKNKPDCIKTFDTFESQIMVFGNIFAIKIFSRIKFVWNRLYCSKTVAFVRTAPVQKVSVLLK